MADAEAGAAAAAGGHKATEKTGLIAADPDDGQKQFSRQYGKYMFALVALACIAAVVIVVVIRQKQQDNQH